MVVRNPDGQIVVHLASAVVLATGGIGRVYSHTTNPPEATGDGLAMAARAGARLGDLEFVQFHPTALAVGADPMPLLTEALRGKGAVIVDETGRRFLRDVDPAAELAARDVVARGIARHLLEGHSAFLDARQAVGDDFPRLFPTVFELCQKHGLDPRREPVPVAPAAHYHMGGVVVDDRGRASLPGLWACGEVSCTGVHGANRLASNSLLEALVFGGRVAEDLGKALEATLPPVDHALPVGRHRGRACPLRPRPLIRRGPAGPAGHVGEGRPLAGGARAGLGGRRDRPMGLGPGRRALRSREPRHRCRPRRPGRPRTGARAGAATSASTIPSSIPAGSGGRC